MLSKRTHPMIGKISELLIGVNRSAAAPFLDILMMTSPRSPLDFKILPQTKSSKRLFNDNLGPSVGLGIVAALDNSNTRQITSLSRFGSSSSKDEEEEEEEEEMFSMDEDDNYTSMTCNERDGFKCLPNKINNDKDRIFMVDIDTELPESSPEFQGLSFLSSCYLCRKKLHGQDIYIYRGEKAFCSTECRSSYIVKDEKKERCNSNFSGSPYTAGQIFTTGGSSHLAGVLLLSNIWG